MATLVSGDVTDELYYIHVGITSSTSSSFGQVRSDHVGTGLKRDEPDPDMYDTFGEPNVQGISHSHDGVSASSTGSFDSTFLLDGHDSACDWRVDVGLVIGEDGESSQYLSLIGFATGVDSTIAHGGNAPRDGGFAGVESDSDWLSTDRAADELYRHDGWSSTILTTLSAPAAEPWGVCWDFENENLISFSRDTDKIYVHVGFSSTIDSEFASPGGNSTVSSVIVCSTSTVEGVSPAAFNLLNRASPLM